MLVIGKSLQPAGTFEPYLVQQQEWPGGGCNNFFYKTRSSAANCLLSVGQSLLPASTFESYLGQRTESPGGDVHKP
jgi:hypothetical protein